MRLSSDTETIIWTSSVPSFGPGDGSDERCRNARIHGIHGVRLHAPHLTSVRVQRIFTFVLWSFVYICLQPSAPEKAEEHEGDAHLPLHKGSQNFGTSEVCLLACLVILVMIFSVPIKLAEIWYHSGLAQHLKSRQVTSERASSFPVIPRDEKKVE